MSYTYGFGELILDYFRWHYGRGVGELMGFVENFLRFILHLFSIKLLLATLFHPWRRMAESYGKGLELETFISSLLVNTIMRAVGFVTRAILIVIGIIFFFTASILGLILIISWFFAPFLIIITFASAISLMIY